MISLLELITRARREDPRLVVVLTDADGVRVEFTASGNPAMPNYRLYNVQRGAGVIVATVRGRFSDVKENK